MTLTSRIAILPALILTLAIGSSLHAAAQETTSEEQGETTAPDTPADLEEQPSLDENKAEWGPLNDQAVPGRQSQISPRA